MCIEERDDTNARISVNDDLFGFCSHMLNLNWNLNRSVDGVMMNEAGTAD